MFVRLDVQEWDPTHDEWHREFIQEIAVELLNRKARLKAPHKWVEDINPYLEEET